MNEIKRITANINGEMPDDSITIIRVNGIDNAAEILDNFKKSVIAFLKHKKLDDESVRWKQLLPAKIIQFVNQLNDDDYSNDILLFPVHSIIYDMKKLKEWEWYSSKEAPKGFKVVVQGNFLPRFIWFIHCQNIPLIKISIEKNNKIYPLKVYKDVTTYKSFD